MPRSGPPRAYVVRQRGYQGGRICMAASPGDSLVGLSCGWFLVERSCTVQAAKRLVSDLQSLDSSKGSFGADDRLFFRKIATTCAPQQNPNLRTRLRSGFPCTSSSCGNVDFCGLWRAYRGRRWSRCQLCVRGVGDEGGRGNGCGGHRDLPGRAEIPGCWAYRDPSRSTCATRFRPRRPA